MTNKQKQCLLCYLGYYSGAIDGIWGPQSQMAQTQFHEDHGADADLRDVICRSKTHDWWQEIEYFQKEEFSCKCNRYCNGYPAEMNPALVRVADRLRKHFRAAVLVSSGLRCKTHNARVGGVSNSRHLSGKAMDFCVVGKTAAAVLEYVQQQPEIRYAYAIDGRYVHMDVA